MDDSATRTTRYDPDAVEQYDAAIMNQESIDTMDTATTQAEEFDATLNNY